MKKILSLLLVLALLFSVGAVSAAAQPSFDELERVVLGEPVAFAAAADETADFAWMVEEDGFFLVDTQNPGGGFWITVLCMDDQIIHQGVSFFFSDTWVIALAAGEYTLQFSAFDAGREINASVIITAKEPHSVTLGQPMTTGQIEVSVFTFTVEEDGYFWFAYNGGDFFVEVRNSEFELLYTLRMLPLRQPESRHLPAGEYALIFTPWPHTFAGSFAPSMIITDTEPLLAPVVLGEWLKHHSV